MKKFLLFLGCFCAPSLAFAGFQVTFKNGSTLQLCTDEETETPWLIKSYKYQNTTDTMILNSEADIIFQNYDHNNTDTFSTDLQSVFDINMIDHTVVEDNLLYNNVKEIVLECEDDKPVFKISACLDESKPQDKEQTINGIQYIDTCQSTSTNTDNTETSNNNSIFTKLDKSLSEHFSKSYEWKDENGEFNTARLASDSIAGVVLGTVGGVVTSNIIKKNQIENGFEDLKCTIAGQDVANYGDTFNVSLK